MPELIFQNKQKKGEKQFNAGKFREEETEARNQEFLAKMQKSKQYGKKQFVYPIKND